MPAEREQLCYLCYARVHLDHKKGWLAFTLPADVGENYQLAVNNADLYMKCEQCKRPCNKVVLA
jgi:hypothetical protein